MISACSIGDFMRGHKTNYALIGTDSDVATRNYLQTILDERLHEKTKTLVKSDEDIELRTRQERYIEQTIKADLLKALHARGYYAAEIDFEKGETSLSGQYNIEYGPQYKISYLNIIPDMYAAALPDEAPQENDILDAEIILAAQDALRSNIGKDRCYFDISVTNQVRLNRSNSSGAVELLANVGREGSFGEIIFTGNDSVKESYLRRLLPWKEGECFRREKLESYKTALLQSGLFAQVETTLPENGPDANGNIPVNLQLKERAQRTIGAGLTYYSDEGLGGVLSWEHRNLFGAAEKLKTELNVSALKQSLGADFSKPYFMRETQTLTLNTELRRQNTDAFEELAADLGASISRKFGKHLSASTGVEASLLRINDNTLNTTETYGLLSAPQTLSYDTRDDTLDPKKGVNVTLAGEPFFDILGEADPFFKVQATGSGYISFGESQIVTLAAKGSIGTIQGADVDSAPATERFYAGGGGSVRGYGYQEVGPQRNGDPSGGLSLATMSLELRSRFTDKLGGVAFIDTGSVSEESTPDFNNLAIGAGVGIRYYTSFGPIRFDVATPLTQKEDLDQNYQFYISIGQAF
jgi:translocation and assembly module TamA